MDDTPLVSVIVPIYNVEKYVRKCLESLQGQTLKQIEVICIDDGSTDGSGRIADEYETTDYPIFRVIHTENRGLSAARNRGINEAQAEHIMFVDSDDWVDKDFCRAPYESSKRYGANLVIFRCDEIKNGKFQKRKQSKFPEGIISESVAQEYGGIPVWNKLYKKQLFDHIRYPEGKVYEDIATTHKLVHEAKIITILDKCLYHYVFRNESISNSHTAENIYEYYCSVLERYGDLLSYGYPENKALSSICISSIRYLSKTKNREDILYKQAKKILDITPLTQKGLNQKQRIALAAWKTNENLFRMISKK